MRLHGFCATALKWTLGIAAMNLPAVTAHAFSKDLAPAVVELGSGYIVDVQTERAEEEQEIVLMEKPDSLNKPSLHDVIFNATLSNEFMFEYQNRFGRTEQEQYYYLTSRQGYYRSPQGTLTATREDDERKAFALYMMKRLGEYHVDNYMKTEPNMRRIYEIKQAVSQVKVVVAQKVKFDFNYNYSSNQAKAACENPIVNTWVLFQMDPNQFYPGEPQQTTVGLQRSITDTVGAETQYALQDKMVKGVVTKQFNPVLAGNVTAVTFMQDRTGSALLSAVNSTSTTKESFLLLGGSLAF